MKKYYIVVESSDSDGSMYHDFYLMTNSPIETQFERIMNIISNNLSLTLDELQCNSFECIITIVKD